MLDALDGDADLEPDLAGPPNDGAPCDAEGDDCDDEPSLGSLGGTWPWGIERWQRPMPQTQWACGGRRDAELDESDREPNGDELDYSDHPSGHDGGIGDVEGLEEQTACFDRSGYEGDRTCNGYDAERFEASRHLKAETRQQALELAARLRSDRTHCNLRVPQNLGDWFVVG